jgi:hypothetical protein
MSTCTVSRGGALLSLRPLVVEAELDTELSEGKKGRKTPNKHGGFGGTGHGKGKKTKKKGTGLSAADRNPLGKAPDVEAMKARGYLHLPLSGRLTSAQVKVAYKKLAASHHPDQGGDIEIMQSINKARDLLLGLNH